MHFVQLANLLRGSDLHRFTKSVHLLMSSWLANQLVYCVTTSCLPVDCFTLHSGSDWNLTRAHWWQFKWKRGKKVRTGSNIRPSPGPSVMWSEVDRKSPSSEERKEKDFYFVKSRTGNKAIVQKVRTETRRWGHVTIGRASPACRDFY